MATVNLNLKIDSETNRVLDIIKAVYGLSNKAEAVEKLVHENGVRLIEPELREEFIAEIVKGTQEWERKYQFKRKMTLRELDAL